MSKNVDLNLNLNVDFDLNLNVDLLETAVAEQATRGRANVNTINMGNSMVIDKELLDKVSEQAKASPRLRMNYNFHQSLDEKCHRFLNAVEPGTEVPIDLWSTSDATRPSLS